jgi:hypothetical protein
VVDVRKVENSRFVVGLTLICEMSIVAKEFKVHRARGKDIRAGGGALTSLLDFTPTEKTGRGKAWKETGTI